MSMDMTDNLTTLTPAVRDDPRENFRKVNFIPYIIIMVVGVLANLIVIVNGIRRRKTIKHYSNYFVLSLAFADFGVVVIALPIALVEYTVGLKGVSSFTCKYIFTIRETFQGAALFSICALSFLRMRQVVRHLLNEVSKRTCVVVVTGIWVLSFLLFTLPMSFIYDMTTDTYECSPQWSSKEQAKAYLTFINIVILTPLITGLISYSIIMCRISEVLREDMDSERLMRRNRSVAVMLVMLIFSCWLSYLPLAIYFMLRIYTNIEPSRTTEGIIKILFFAGSAFNPVLVLVTMGRDYGCFSHCRPSRRVAVEPPVMVPKRAIKSTFCLHETAIKDVPAC